MDPESANADNESVSRSPAAEKVEVISFGPLQQYTLVYCYCACSENAFLHGYLCFCVNSLFHGFQDLVKEEYVKVEVHLGGSDKDNSPDHTVKPDDTEDDLSSYQVPTLAILEKSSLQLGSTMENAEKEIDASCEHLALEHPEKGDHDEALVNGEIGSPESSRRKITTNGGTGNLKHAENSSFGFGSKSQDSFKKVKLLKLLRLDLLCFGCWHVVIMLVVMYICYVWFTWLFSCISFLK